MLSALRSAPNVMGVQPADTRDGWDAEHAAADAPAVACPDLRRYIRRDRRRAGSANRPVGPRSGRRPERCPALKRRPFQPSVSRRSRVSTRSYRPASGFDLPPQSTHPARSCPGDQCPSAQRAADRGRQCGHGVTDSACDRSILATSRSRASCAASCRAACASTGSPARAGICTGRRCNTLTILATYSGGTVRHPYPSHRSHTLTAASPLLRQLGGASGPPNRGCSSLTLLFGDVLIIASCGHDGSPVRSYPVRTRPGRPPKATRSAGRSGRR